MLRFLERILGDRFRVSVADRPAEALEILDLDGPFEVVVSDLEMPEMDGISLLCRVRDISPDTVRILLTGHANLEAAIAATNEGQIFRFLRKPTGYDDLLRTTQAAAEQYRLVTAERVLLEKTLSGCIRTLTDILAAVNPDVFGRASRIRNQMSDLLDWMGFRDHWHIEVATMLSQIGIVTLPPPKAEKLYRGHSLSRLDQEMVDQLPGISDRLLSGIPRLEAVREIIVHQNRRFDGTGSASGSLGTDIPWGARALRILLDRDVLECQGLAREEANEVLRGRNGWYDPEILETIIGVGDLEATGREIREVSVAELREGMVLASDVETLNGIKMIARGQELTEGILLRLRNFAIRVGVKEPIRMILPVAGPPA